VFYLVRAGVWDRLFLILELLPVTIIILSFRTAFGQSKLWELTHSSIEKLDEREVELVYKATTKSYPIFAILCVILIDAFELMGLGSIDVVLAAFLLYFAHTLPAAIIAWNQKVITETE
jgi:hypothetical protein